MLKKCLFSFCFKIYIIYSKLIFRWSSLWWTIWTCESIKKLTYFLKINTDREMEGVCCAVLFGVEQVSMGRVRNSLKISFRQLYVDRLEVVGKKRVGLRSFFFCRRQWRKGNRNRTSFNLRRVHPNSRQKSLDRIFVKMLGIWIRHFLST